jgi:serine/threonine protein phosphatase PrpC
MGQLAVTRAFGDFEYTQHGLSCTPELKILQLEGKEKYLILATDGLWDVIDDNVIINN